MQHCSVPAHSLLLLALASCQTPLPNGAPPAAVPATSTPGPLPVRNQHPAQLSVLQLPPAATELQPAGSMTVRADLAWTSLFLGDGVPGDRFRMDGEYLRAATSLRLGLGELGPGRLELGAELAVAHTGGGVLDGFLIDYHRLLWLPDQGRQRVPQNQFEVVAERDGQRVYGVDRSEFELLDLPVWLTWNLRRRSAGVPGFAIRGGIELPTGDARRGYGSGGVDASLGILMDAELAGLVFYGHAQHSWANTPAVVRDAGGRFADVTQLGLAMEWPWTQRFSAFAQLAYETSTLRPLAQRVLERDQLLLWLGGRYRLGSTTSPGSQWALEFAVGEDLIGYVSPDVTFWFGCVFTPGGG